jgi:anaerobic selenocysteine-containing dehydrogenase
MNKNAQEVQDGLVYNPEIYHKEFQWQDGDLTATRTIWWSAPGCHNGCQIILYTDKDGKLVKVEGDPNGPYNKGRLCMRCLALPEVVNHPDRIKYPMRRTGERGENKWERISWEEALDELTGKAKELQTKYGPNTVVVSSITARNAYHLSPSLAWASFGSTHGNVAWYPGDSCYLPRMTSMGVMMGRPMVADCAQMYEEGYNHPEWQAPDYMIIWGNNPLKSNADGFYGHWVIDLMRQGTKLITIDPENNWLATRSEYFIQLRPATDGTIAMAMLNIIIAEDLYNHDFVDKWVYGFEQLADSVKDMTPEKAGETAGVEPEVIRGAARAFATSKVASVQWGLAIDSHTHGSATAHAIIALSAICGFIDVPGGNIFGTGSYFAGDVENAFMSIAPDSVKDRSEANYESIPGYVNYPFRRTDPVPASQAVLEELELDEPTHLSMLYATNTNTIACGGAEAQRLYEDFKKFEYIVVADVFMTPLALGLADLVLPIAMSSERNSFREWWAPAGPISKVSQFYEAKSDEQLILEIGKRMRPEAFPWKNEIELQDWLISKRVHTGDYKTFKEAQEKVYIYTPFTYRKYEKGLLRQDGGPGFDTPTGRIEVFSIIYDHSGLSGVPYYVEPELSPVRTPELMKEFPFVLTTGRRCYEYFHSEHRQIKTLRSFHPDPLVCINPEDAAELGVKFGDWVWIENIYGKCKMKAEVSPAMKKGVVSSEHGWWFPERNPEDGTIFGVFESNINNCTTQSHVGKSGYGTSYKSLICKIYKVTPENDTLQRTPEEDARALAARAYPRPETVIF